MNNLALSPDSQLAFALATLRGLELSCRALNGQHIVPGIFFSLDPEAENAVHIDSRLGEMMAITMEVERPGRWLTLNMGIGNADFSGCKIVGFACKLDAPQTTTFQVCIRSGTQTGHSDVYFPKTVVAFPKTSLHLDVIELEQHAHIPAEAPWRELVIFFQREPAEIVLRDFRLIVI